MGAGLSVCGGAAVNGYQTVITIPEGSMNLLEKLANRGDVEQGAKDWFTLDQAMVAMKRTEDKTRRVLTEMVRSGEAEAGKMSINGKLVTVWATKGTPKTKEAV
jgi:hypothetical protein